MGPVPRGSIPAGPPHAARGPAGEPELSAAGYRIDYDNLDVVDLVAQIRERARRAEADPVIETDLEARTRVRLRAALDLDDERPYELQDSLGLAGDWNVTPQDLVGSREGGGLGALLGIFRRLVRPGLKLFANFDRSLYKQFKINLGIAEALHELLSHTTELEAQLQDVCRRLETLETRDSAPAALEARDSASAAAEARDGASAAAEDTTSN